MTLNHKRWRHAAELALSFLGFVMGGYAYGSLYTVLHSRLSSEVDSLLRGAGIFLVLYAALVHFEPFVLEWRRRGAIRTLVLYVCFGFCAVTLGALLEDAVLRSHFSSRDAGVLAVALAIGLVGWAIYRLTSPPSRAAGE